MNGKGFEGLIDKANMLLKDISDYEESENLMNVDESILRDCSIGHLRGILEETRDAMARFQLTDELLSTYHQREHTNCFAFALIPRGEVLHAVVVCPEELNYSVEKIITSALSGVFEIGRKEQK